MKKTNQVNIKILEDIIYLDIDISDKPHVSVVRISNNFYKLYEINYSKYIEIPDLSKIFDINTNYISFISRSNTIYRQMWVPENKISEAKNTLVESLEKFLEVEAKVDFPIINPTVIPIEGRKEFAHRMARALEESRWGQIDTDLLKEVRKSALKPGHPLTDKLIELMPAWAINIGSLYGLLLLAASVGYVIAKIIP